MAMRSNVRKLLIDMGYSPLSSWFYKHVFEHTQIIAAWQKTLPSSFKSWQRRRRFDRQRWFSLLASTQISSTTCLKKGWVRFFVIQHVCVGSLEWCVYISPVQPWTISHRYNADDDVDDDDADDYADTEDADDDADHDDDELTRSEQTETKRSRHRSDRQPAPSWTRAYISFFSLSALVW